MKVLNNTFKVLDIFLEHPSEISLDELTRLSKLNKTTLSRIVRELVKYGFLMQPVDDRGGDLPSAHLRLDHRGGARGQGDEPRGRLARSGRHCVRDPFRHADVPAGHPGDVVVQEPARLP